MRVVILQSLQIEAKYSYHRIERRGFKEQKCELHAGTEEMRMTNINDKSEDLTRERIRKRAYELYQQRGCQEGRALDDWLDAEYELGVSHESTEPETSRAATASR